ncbi:MAG: HAD family phosphatase [Patescibacteria group bacterium]|nr:HAD family phosphatase [Patescibacteria group bacterium]
MVRAVIFDMDGTMIMTEELSSRAFHRVLTRRGVVPALKTYGCVQEVGTINNMAKLKREYGLWQPLWWLKFRQKAAYRQAVKQDGRPTPGLLALLKILRQAQLPLAVASGSPDAVIRFVTDSLGVRDYFHCLVSSRSLRRNKPFPDVYLEAACRLGVPPASCLAVEDQGVGVQAAKAAGMKVVAVPNRFTINDDFSAADLVLPSLEQLTWEVISSL